MSIEPVRRQSIVSFIWQIAFTFISFLSTMYFAHTLGANVLGSYFLFIAYFGIIGIIIEKGLGIAAIKRISEGDEQDAYFSAFSVLRILLMVLTIIVLISFRNYFVDFNSGGLFTWLLLALIVSLFHETISRCIAGCGKMGIHSTGEFINNVSRILVQVIAVLFGFGAAGLAGGFVAGMMVAAIIELRFFELHFVRFGWRHVKSLATYSTWSFLVASGGIVFSYADTVMIGYYLNNTDVGVYRVVLQFTTFAVLTSEILRTTLWPKISRWGKIGEKELIEISLSRAFTYSLILAVPMLAGGVLLGDRLLYFFYGAEFENGYATFVILLLVQIVNIFRFFFTSYLNALDQIKEVFKVTLVAVTINIVLNIVLIPVIGIVGAAVATLVTMTLNVVLAKCILSKFMIIRVESDSLLNILKATTAMILFVGGYRLIVPLSSVLLALVPVVVGGIIYVVLVLKFDKKIYDELKGIMTQMNLSSLG